MIEKNIKTLGTLVICSCIVVMSLFLYVSFKPMRYYSAAEIFTSEEFSHPHLNVGEVYHFKDVVKNVETFELPRLDNYDGLNASFENNYTESYTAVTFESKVDSNNNAIVYYQGNVSVSYPIATEVIFTLEVVEFKHGTEYWQTFETYYISPMLLNLYSIEYYNNNVPYPFHFDLTSNANTLRLTLNDASGFFPTYASWNEITLNLYEPEYGNWSDMFISIPFRAYSNTSQLIGLTNATHNIESNERINVGDYIEFTIEQEYADLVGIGVWMTSERHNYLLHDYLLFYMDV